MGTLVGPVKQSLHSRNCDEKHPLFCAFRRYKRKSNQ